MLLAQEEGHVCSQQNRDLTTLIPPEASLEQAAAVKPASPYAAPLRDQTKRQFQKHAEQSEVIKQGNAGYLLELELGNRD